MAKFVITAVSGTLKLQWKLPTSARKPASANYNERYSETRIYKISCAKSLMDAS